MKMGLGMATSHSMKVERGGGGLREHWNRKLFKSDNNPFPLAPKDLVRAGLVTSENYFLENQRLGQFRSSVMEKELEGLKQDPVFSRVNCPTVVVFGLGSGRDTAWMERAFSLGFEITGCDVSPMACEKFSSSYSPGSIRVVEGNVKEDWNEILMDADGVLAYCAMQFIQVLDVKSTDTMGWFMRKLRFLLEQKPTCGNLRPERRVYIVHPFAGDNNSPREWCGREFPCVEWGDTTPYTLEELLAKTGDCSSWSVDLLGVHMYYHQKYSFLRLMRGGAQ